MYIYIYILRHLFSDFRYNDYDYTAIPGAQSQVGHPLKPLRSRPY